MATILIIGDDPRIRSCLREVVQRMGHWAIAATTSHEGIHLFRQIRIELVITDVFVPDTDGLELIKVLHQASPTVPTIGPSGRAEGNKLLDVAKSMGPSAPWKNYFLSRVVFMLCGKSYKSTSFPGKMEHQNSSNIEPH